jgi:hypothetical protein|tara:strand:- start:108 stop:1190 length:1083 start_codon:yes stop_codon:yes gene_type:complete
MPTALLRMAITAMSGCEKMKIFTCPTCNGPLYFDNLTCACGTSVSFDPEAEAFEQLDVPCANREQIDCNWHAEAGPGTYCRACAMTEIVPDSLVTTNIPLWADTEAAKRWVLVNLGQWGWLKANDAGQKPRFHLLSEHTSTGHAPVTMGHADGLITINVTEADPARRVERRERLSERYRTLTGHFRHELGHYVFFRLVQDAKFADAFRKLFGDERADYGAALSRHYEQGPPQDWQTRHITGYASSHPHEDWAESFAHIVHLTDMLDSANAARLKAPGADVPDAYRAADSESVISAGASLGLALNHINRSMGLADIYPFVIAPKVRKKLKFVREAVAKGPIERTQPHRRKRNWNPFRSASL